MSVWQRQETQEMLSGVEANPAIYRDRFPGQASDTSTFALRGDPETLGKRLSSEQQTVPAPVGLARWVSRGSDRGRVHGS
jgi:hypothetical protein